MKFSLWLVLFALAFIAEVSFLPRIFGPGIPHVSFAVFLLGVASQEFLPALWFAGSAGMIRNFFAPTGDPTHTIFFFAIMLAIHFFERASRWDELAKRIGGILFGILVIPLAWDSAIGIGMTLFRISAFGFHWSDLASKVGAQEGLFTIIWFSVFAWISVRWFRNNRSRALAMLR